MPQQASSHGGYRLASLAVLVVLGGALILAYLGKAACLDGQDGFWAYTHYCYSDVWALWEVRGFDRDTFPYQEPGRGGDPRLPSFEYPPGIGLPAYAIGLLTDSRRDFFRLTAAAFVAAAVVTAWQLDIALRALGRSRLRLLGFVLSPTLVVLGMQNWDLWVLPFVAAGLATASRGRPILAAAFWGVGAAVKWWPALLVVTVMVGPWQLGRTYGRDSGAATSLLTPWRRWTPVLAATVAWTLVQLPVLLASPRSWWDATAFHLRRPPNLESTAAALARLGDRLIPMDFWTEGFLPVVSVVTLALLAGGTAFVATWLARERIAPEDGALALVTLFLVSSKVFSPQFVLWLLPVAVAASVSWTPVLAVESSNLFVWFWVGLAYASNWQVHGLLAASQISSVVRTFALTWLLISALASKREQGPLGRTDEESVLAEVDQVLCAQPPGERVSSVGAVAPGDGRDGT